MKDTNAPVESKCNGHRSPGGSVSYCFGHCQSVPVEKWPDWKTNLDNELQLLVARVQSEETLAAQIEHGRDFTERIADGIEKVLSQAIQAARIEAKEEERSRIALEVAQETVDLCENSQEFKHTVLSIINKHQ